MARGGQGVYTYASSRQRGVRIALDRSGGTRATMPGGVASSHNGAALTRAKYLPPIFGVSRGKITGELRPACGYCSYVEVPFVLIWAQFSWPSL